MARLGEGVTKAINAGADAIHIDVMDNHYVPNLTFGPLVVKALRDYGISVPLDVHLMVKPVDRIIPDFAEAGADYITFHPEASEHIDRSLQLIKDCGCKPGLVFNPATPLNILDHIIEKIDMILLMSVNPGFGGQAFIPSTINKLRQARQIIDLHEKYVSLAVDGGINTENIAEVADAGADNFIIGSAIFGAEDYSIVLQTIRNKLAEL